MPAKLRVRLRKSPISYTAKTRGTVRALGLHRLHETVELPDNPAIRGMVRAVRFLVEVEAVPVPSPAAARARRRAPATTAPATTPEGAATVPAADAAAPAVDGEDRGAPAAPGAQPSEPASEEGEA